MNHGYSDSKLYGYQPNNVSSSNYTFATPHHGTYHTNLDQSMRRDNYVTHDPNSRLVNSRFIPDHNSGIHTSGMYTSNAVHHTPTFFGNTSQYVQPSTYVSHIPVHHVQPMTQSVVVEKPIVVEKPVYIESVKKEIQPVFVRDDFDQGRSRVSSDQDCSLYGSRFNWRNNKYLSDYWLSDRRDRGSSWNRYPYSSHTDRYDTYRGSGYGDRYDTYRGFGYGDRYDSYKGLGYENRYDNYRSGYDSLRSDMYRDKYRSMDYPYYRDSHWRNNDLYGRRGDMSYMTPKEREYLYDSWMYRSSRNPYI